MNPVSIVTIASKHKLYKKEDEATSVELIKISEAAFELVAQKDLYQVGDKAIYIQPDYNLSDIPLFESFIRPNGDESKSMLGKVDGQPRRIRAKKFTLSKEPNGESVYSNGILLPYAEVQAMFIQNIRLYPDNLTENLGITKYEEPEVLDKQGNSVGGQRFPVGIYKTDEDNILKVGKRLGYPIALVGTEKVDGSSITIGVTEQYPEGFICSRNLMKKIWLNKVVGKKSKTLLQRLQFWKTFDLNIYESVLNDDIFVRIGYPYLQTLLLQGQKDIILRGELRGESCKGSGNKYNPAAKLKNDIEFFGLDKVVEGVAIKESYDNFSNFCFLYDLPKVKTVFNRPFESFEEVLEACNNHFKNNKIEGIVVRTRDSSFSAKVMSLEYDSKK